MQENGGELEKNGENVRNGERTDTEKDERSTGESRGAVHTELYGARCIGSRERARGGEAGPEHPESKERVP